MHNTAKQLNFFDKHKGTKVGLIFTVGSLLLTLTYVIPIISVLPRILAEKLVAMFVDPDPYSNVSKGVIIILSVGLALVITGFLIIERYELKRGKAVHKRLIYLLMTIIYFILHPLGFYIYWALVLDYRNDGQLIFGAINSFPVSSIGFVIIGYLIDRIKRIIINSL
ncbi:hypothetical protein LVD15_13855 [Fulvivirga maritima]|uniref:hypothetical protein n=1 Tax=Fulvivirga maritima TaxID=2904247 RepID=UPI001F3F3ADF|nr:hypothetical protein [Fulvivirga maritima]UII24407.1 hypothetical protein LVD15_13855 [Fulvivirga maritima]